MLSPGLPLVRHAVSGTPGTGTFTLGAAISGYLSVAGAGGVNGRTYNYGAEGGYSAGLATKREVGRGVWTSADGHLTRETILASTNGGAAEDFPSDTQVVIAPLGDDLDWMVTTNSVAVALADAATVAIDWQAGINFTLDLSTSRTLGNPTNGVPGTWRSVLVTQPAGGAAVLTFDTEWVFPFASVPIIQTGNGAKSRLMLYCRTSSIFEAYGGGIGLAAP